MPGRGGVDATKAILREMPKVRIIGLSMFSAEEGERVMREAGAVGYMSKDRSARELVQAVRTAAGAGAPHGRMSSQVPLHSGTRSQK